MAKKLVPGRAAAKDRTTSPRPGPISISTGSALPKTAVQT
jgi:hypothetical protein